MHSPICFFKNSQESHKSLIKQYKRYRGGEEGTHERLRTFSVSKAGKENQTLFFTEGGAPTCIHINKAFVQMLIRSSIHSEMAGGTYPSSVLVYLATVRAQTVHFQYPAVNFHKIGR